MRFPAFEGGAKAMFDKKRKYSYAETRTENLKKLTLLFWAGVFFFAYVLLTSFVITVRDLQNTSMLPGLAPGDRFVFLSFGIKDVFPDFPAASPLPLSRGDVVLVNLKNGEKRGFFLALADKVWRFCTLGRIGLLKNERVFLKRVIAKPGDEISMVNYVMRVRPYGEVYTYTEFELSKDLYTVNIPEVPPLWDGAIPFSGSMEPVVLGEDMYFLLSDDRGNTNDSRTWGAVSGRFISARALLRYWPPARFGKI
ncbi:MAG: signal peptidase I [Spirochaetaceae bacterium]|jgi:signal peptidase I|nr:signal peptidase I [Spirochaetaceae bacterium]